MNVQRDGKCIEDEEEAEEGLSSLPPHTNSIIYTLYEKFTQKNECRTFHNGAKCFCDQNRQKCTSCEI